MAEKVQDGVNGLHFVLGNPGSLAGAIGRAVTSPGLWDSLRSGVPPVHTMDDHIANLTRHYQGLLASRSDNPSPEPTPAQAP